MDESGPTYEDMAADEAVALIYFDESKKGM